MSTEYKRSMGWMVLLMLFGVAALLGGVKWLTVLIPAAMLVWLGARPMLGSGRN